MIAGWAIGNVIIALILTIWLLAIDREKIPMETRTDAIALTEGYLTKVVDELIERCLPDKLIRSSREAMLGHYFIIEYTTDSLPTYVWSTGERLLWDLLTSLAGRGAVNLSLLSSYYSGTDEWPLILKAIGALS
jgi:hypothetical protein